MSDHRDYLTALQMYDPLKEIRESMKALQTYDPLKEIRESMKALQTYDPLKEIRESIKGLQTYDPLKEIRESMKALQTYDPLKEIRESMKGLQMHDPLKEIRESMKALQMYDPLKEIRESIKGLQMHDPLKEIRESMKALQMYDPLKEIRESIRVLANDRWVLEFKDESNIHINPNGYISIGANSISQLELQDIAHQVVSSAFADYGDQLSYKIDKMIGEIRLLKDPFLQKLLSWLIYPLIVGLILAVVTPMTDFYIKRTLNSREKKLVVKEVRATISGTVQENSCLSSFRIVTADILNVRKSGSNKSPILGTLYLGDVVEVLEKGRKWSLVSWHDNENDVTLKGWVFSRYLKAIR